MKNFLVALLFISFSSAYCQVDSALYRLKPQSIVKFNPMYLLNRFPTIQLTYEHSLSQNFNISVGAGYIMNINDEDFDHDFDNRSGVKLNADLRYYYEAAKRMIFFASLGVDYFYINFDRSRTFGFDCVNDFSCLYYQYDQYEVIREDYRINVKSGFMIDLGANIYFETGLGIAISYQHYRTLGKLTGFDIQYGDNRLKEEGKRTRYLPLPIVQFGYRIR